MMTPTLHLNGSSQKTLETQVRAAHQAAHELIDRLHDMAPHGRDYYPQGDDAIHTATLEHRARIEGVRALLTELESLSEVIANARR